MLLELTPGKQCVFREHVVEIDGPLSSAVVAVRDVATGELLEAPVGDLRPLREQSPLLRDDARFVPRKKWERARLFAEAFAAIVMSDGPLDAAEASRLAKLARLSVRTVRRRFSRFRLGRRTSDLLPRTCGRREGSRLCSADLEEIISQCIETHYLNRQAPTIAYLAEQVGAECRKHQLKPPARSTLTRRIDTIAPYERERRRRGRVAAKQKYAPRPGYLKAEQPLEIVQIDHTRCDVMLVAEDDRKKVLGRPWLTVAIDVYSRCVVGFLVSFDPPSATAVALCLEHAVLPKDAWLRARNFDAAWPMYGKPAVLLLDNGADFHSEALRRGCEEFGITLQYRPVKQPHYGAHVERLIGTLMQRVHLIPGTTFSNSKERGDYNSAKRAVMTLREFIGWLVDQVARWYHAKPHRGLGDRTPSQVWEAGWRKGDVLTLPPVVASPIELRAAFLPVAWRKVQRTGLELWGLRYWHDALAPLIGSDERVCVRYDPRDIRYVLVREPGGQLLELPVVSPDAPPLSLAEYRDRRRQAREEGRDVAQVVVRDEGARRTAQGLLDAARSTKTERRLQASAEQRRVDGQEQPRIAVVDSIPSLPMADKGNSLPFVAVAEIWQSLPPEGES